MAQQVRKALAANSDHPSSRICVVERREGGRDGRREEQKSANCFLTSNMHPVAHMHVCTHAHSCIL